MFRISLFLCISIFIDPVYNAHFRGGVISWRPETNAPSVLNTKRTMIVDQRYAWSRSSAASACTSTTIQTYGLIGSAGPSTLTCESTAAICSSVQYTATISIYVPCTDYNAILGMSYGYSSEAFNVSVKPSGFILGYVGTGAWLTLQMSSGTWSLLTYINMVARPDNGLINNSPTSDIQPVVYAPVGVVGTTSIDIPMSDVDGDNLECRFALSSSSLGGVAVDECAAACAAVALPASTQLISGNNTCTLIVRLTSVGYYAVAIQVEDFLANSTTALSSIPVQFLLLGYDASNPTSSCTLPPNITDISPDYPSPGSTIIIQVTVLYAATVIARTGCDNDTDTSITNFITRSPPGMVKSNLPYAMAPPFYAINLAWTPTIDQLGQTFEFCATAINSNYYSSSQYCFYIYVGPKTTTTSSTSTSSTTSTTTTSTTETSSTSSTSTTTTSVTTTSTTTTTDSTTTVTPFDYMPLVLGLGLGLGLPLLLLLSLISLLYLCRWCPGPLRSILRYRYGKRADMYCQHCQRSTLFDESDAKSNIPEDTRRYRQQYVNDNIRPLSSRPPTGYLQRHNGSTSESVFSSSGRTVTSLFSPSIHGLPTEHIPRSLSPPQIELQHHGSILLRAYCKQVHPQ